MATRPISCNVFTHILNLFTFLQQTGTKQIRDLKADIQYVSTSCKVIYVPAFLAIYYYDHSNHFFVVNGRTGAYDGQRPSYGLGKIGDIKKGVNNMMGTIMGWNLLEEKGIVSGKELTEKDNAFVYQTTASYIMFPRSNSYLLTEMIGIQRNKNNRFCEAKA